MTKAPKRPAGIPAKAWWDPGDNEWVFGPLVDGKKHGDFTFWRADGTKCNECHLVMDVPQGPFKRFHENGELSQEGAFDEKGQLHGTRRWFGTDSETTEQLRPSGVHDSIFKSEMDYVHGRVVGIRHFNREGERVVPTSGEPYPERPEGVDEGAEYFEPRDEWHKGDAVSSGSLQFAPEASARPSLPEGEQKKVGPWRIWTRDGQLKKELTYVDDVPQGPATFHLRGESPFIDARIAMEKGELRDGRRTGVWLLCDAKGATVGKCDYGDTRSLEGGPLAAFSNDAKVDYAALAKKLEGEGKIVEALITWARVAGLQRDTGGFNTLLARVSRPVKEDVALSLAMEADRPNNWLGYELVEGAHAAVILNKVAIALDQAFQSRAALDFTNAAMLLAPDRTEFLFTRALIMLSLGLASQAERDANDLAAEAPDRAEFLLSYVKGLFPSWGFEPASVKPHTTFDDVPEKPDRSVEELQALVAKYATRLQRVRDAVLVKLTPENPAVPPDLSKLLPDGPVELEAGEHEWEDDDGETQSVDFDEVPQLDGADLPSLLRIARADWGALSWLCWSAGLSEIATPSQLSPPEDFGKAAGMAQQRLWRARDQRSFKGRNAQQHGVASFEWEGLDIAELEPPIAGIAEQQYAEMQALFYWLVDSKLKTPWQDNLRGS